MGLRPRTKRFPSCGEMRYARGLRHEREVTEIWLHFRYTAMATSKKGQPRQVSVSVRLPPTDVRRLDERGRPRKMSRSDVVRELVRDGLDQTAVRELQQQVIQV